MAHDKSMVSDFLADAYTSVMLSSPSDDEVRLADLALKCKRKKLGAFVNDKNAKLSLQGKPWKMAVTKTRNCVSKIIQTRLLW